MSLEILQQESNQNYTKLLAKFRYHPPQKIFKYCNWKVLLQPYNPLEVINQGDIIEYIISIKYDREALLNSGLIDKKMINKIYIDLDALEKVIDKISNAEVVQFFFRYEALMIIDLYLIQRTFYYLLEGYGSVEHKKEKKKWAPYIILRLQEILEAGMNKLKEPLDQTNYVNIRNFNELVYKKQKTEQIISKIAFDLGMMNSDIRKELPIILDKFQNLRRIDKDLNNLKPCIKLKPQSHMDSGYENIDSLLYWFLPVIYKNRYFKDEEEYIRQRNSYRNFFEFRTKTFQHLTE
jgi:hypothetical protein